MNGNSAVAKNLKVSNGNAKADVDYFAFAGQSNADGHFFTFDYDNTPGELGSVVFANNIEEITGHRPDLINVASGGAGSSEISNLSNFWWNIGQDKPSQVLLDAITNIKAAIGGGKDLDGIIWAQGETDALAINDTNGLTEFFTNNFIEATVKTFEYFWAELGSDIPIFVQEIGDYPGYRGFDAMRDAQRQIVKQFDNVFLGAETGDLAYLEDNIHFTTTSKGIIAEDLAETVGKVVAGDQPTPTELNVILGTVGDNFLPGTNGGDIINGFEGLDVFGGSTGDDFIRGGDVGYNQVDYDGASTDYKFVRNIDGSITVTKPSGKDKLADIDGFWFRGEEVWKSLEDVLDPSSAPPPGETITGTAGDDFLAGTAGDDVIDGLGGLDVFGGSKGDDIIKGGDIGYNQVDYDGSVSDYTFVSNADGSISVTKPNGLGTDTLTDIDGFWFRDEGVWKALNDVLEPSEPPTGGATIIGTLGDDFLLGTNGDDIIDGLAGVDVFGGSKGNDIIRGGDFGYNQVDYDGASTDYTFSRNDDGSITVTKPDGDGVDTLSNIDGFWFRGEAVWKPAGDLINPTTPVAPGETITGTAGDDYLIGTEGDDVIDTGLGLDVVRGSAGNDTIKGSADGYDQMDYDGSLADYTFTKNSDGTVSVGKNGGLQTDNLTDFDGLWFIADASFHSLDDVLAEQSEVQNDDLF